MDYASASTKLLLTRSQFLPHLGQKHPVYPWVMSAQVTVGELCLRATTAIYVTASAGTKQQNAPRPAHQASETIKTRMRIMRRLVPAHILGIKALRLTRSPSYYFFFFLRSLGHWTLIKPCCVLRQKCERCEINHETGEAITRESGCEATVKTALCSAESAALEKEKLPPHWHFVLLGFLNKDVFIC